jgi:hypothetical protein
MAFPDSVVHPEILSFWFLCSQVFDEYASQEEVYIESLSHVPKELMQGINCAVLAYGQAGTGKSHTMFGEAKGGEMNARARNDDDQIKNNPELSQDLEITEGMIARVVRELFRQIQNNDLPPSVEVTVRCSYVELYLEKIHDLLQPSRKGIRVGAGEDGEFCLLGASELCCLNPKDVYTLLARGNAFRAASATGQNSDSPRSNGVFVLQLNQTNHETGAYTRSLLYMLDLAGSDTGRTRSSRQLDTPGAMEARMVSASLQSVYTYIRAKLVEQGKEKGRIHPNAYANVSKLARILKPCLGGNFHTTFLCTASPSSYNIDETIATIKFGQKARLLQNFPIQCQELARKDYRTRLSKSDRRVTYLTRFVKVLAQECRMLRKTGKARQPHKSPVWDAVSKIAKSGDDDDGSDLNIQISIEGDSAEEKEEDTDEATYTAKLEEHRLAREKAENGMREYHSEIRILKSQLEQANKENKRMERDLYGAKEEIEVANSRRADIEVRLRTSRYRENEAVVFLRQFRSFYLRLLKSKAAQGNGSTSQVIDDALTKIPGAPNFAKLLDIDKLMVDSGLVEKDEVGEDSNAAGYEPSEEATARSNEQSEKAEDMEMYFIQEMTGASESVLRALEPGQLITYRQKLVTTPAGKVAMKAEREIEREILELSHKVVTLQNAVNAEKAMVVALSARQGALGKMKSAQEMNVLKTELERKTNDLQAIVWKMNELHLVNKTIDGKLEHRESHISYLEDHLATLQTKNRRLEERQLEGDKKLREESSNLKQQLDGITLKLWQLGESSPEMSEVWRFIVPCTGETVDMESKGTYERIGDAAEDTITLLENPERPHRSSASTQTDTASTAAATTQTDTAATTEISIQTDEPSRLQSVAVEISTQTDDVEIACAETTEMEVQTDVPYPDMPDRPECAEIEIQTDESARMNSEAIEIATQTDEEVKPVVEGKEIAIQTDEEETKTAAAVSDISTQTEEEPAESSAEVKPELTEISTQTDSERTNSCMETATQTDQLPKEIALSKSESSASLELSRHEGEPVSGISEHGKRPAKPKPFDSISRHTTDGLGLNEDLDGSLQFQNSLSSINSFGIQSIAAASPPQQGGKKAGFSHHNIPQPDNIHGRLGASMSAIHGGHTQATVDWRSKMRQQGKDAASTPQPPVKEKVSSKSILPRPPFPHSGMVSQPVLSHDPSPTVRKKQPTFGTSSNTPIWSSKYKEMGIKGGDESEETTGGKRFRPPKIGNRMPPKAKSAMNMSTIPKPPVSGTPEWMSKFKAMGIKADGNETDPEPEVPPPKEEEEPEWKKQFKKIGMKGEEVIIEGPPPPEKKAAPAPPKPKTPEWMLKFKQMGIDGGEAK